jgi:signal transduction histidine kinase
MPSRPRSERLRAGDRDRDEVAEVLGEQHLAGRLDHGELERRLELCLTASTYAELGAIVADLPVDEQSFRTPTVSRSGRRATMTGMRARRVIRWSARLVAILVLGIWALSSASLPFWPAWVWIGLAIPLWLDGSIRWARRRPRGPVRQAAVVWSVAGVVEATLIAIWVLEWINSGSPPYFWPAWPLLGFLAFGSAHSIIVLHDQVDATAARAALAARVETLSRSRREAANAEAAELGRIERDLHDGAQARLVALSMQLGRAELALEDQPAAQQLVQDARKEASRAISDLRSLSRGIVPPLLSDRGLAAAARALVAQHGAEFEVAGPLEHERLPAPVERCAYFVVAESLTNAVKHAAASRVCVRLALAGNELVVTVADNGRGGANAAGSGLSGLRTRVESVGGTLRIASVPGEGTALEARIPCES